MLVSMWTEADEIDWLRMAFVDAAQRGLPQPDQPTRGVALELRDPQVVGVEARLLVVRVGMVAEQHPDRRVEHLDGHPVEVLLDQSGGRIPTAGVQLIPTHERERVDALRRASRGGDHPVRDPSQATVDLHDRTHRVVGECPWGPVPEVRIDSIDVAVTRFGDVRVGGDREQGHPAPSRLGASCGTLLRDRDHRPPARHRAHCVQEWFGFACIDAAPTLTGPPAGSSSRRRLL